MDWQYDDDDDDFVNPNNRLPKDEESDRKKRGGALEKDGCTKTKKRRVSTDAASSKLVASAASSIGEKVTSSSSHAQSVQDHSDLEKSADTSKKKKKDGLLPCPLPAPIQYNVQYGSLAIKLINLGMIDYMRVPITHIIDRGSSRSFNDILSGEEHLHPYFSRHGNASSLEVSLAGQRPYDRSRNLLLRKVKRGPYNLFVWINVHHQGQLLIHGVRSQGSALIHQLNHMLIGFIYKTSTNDYKSIVRCALGWIDSTSLESVADSHCMSQLLSRTVSLLYGYNNPELFIPAARAAGEVTFSLKDNHRIALLESLRGLGLKEYEGAGNLRAGGGAIVRDHDYQFDQWKAFGASVLNVQNTNDFDMDGEQRNSLRQMIRDGNNKYSSGVINSNAPSSTINMEGNNFIARVTFGTGVIRHYKLCHRCLSRYFAIDVLGNCVCFRHLPNDGSAGIFCVFIYHTSPVQMDLFKVEITCVPNREAPVRISCYPHAEIRQTLYTTSAEEAMGTFFVVSTLKILHNILYGIASPSYTLVRKPYMNLTPKVYTRDLEDICSLLRIDISAVPIKESVITEDESIRYGVLFSADNKRNPNFSYIYLKEYEGDSAASTLFYVGKCSRRKEGQMICNSKKDFGVHIRNSIVLQTPDPNLIDTLESATQFTYCIASLLNVKKNGKSVVVANSHVDMPRAVLDGTTFFEYLKLIFRHQFSHELFLTERQ